MLRTELQQSNFKISVFRSTNTIEVISNYLDILTGIPANTILKPQVDQSSIYAENIDLQQSLSEAFQNREEIKCEHVGVKLAESNLSITKGAFKPNVNANLILNIEYPAQWPNYVNILNYWATGVSLNWDVSSFYGIKHRVTGINCRLIKVISPLKLQKTRLKGK